MCERTMAVSQRTAKPPGYALYLVSRATTQHQISSAESPGQNTDDAAIVLQTEVRAYLSSH